LKEAIVDASGSRLEPILLTSVTSILGLLPITISDPFWRGLGGAIISGLLFSGIVKLFFVPIVYYTWYKSEENIEVKKVHAAAA
jgi:multidrug efflux pump subunit AcrB